MNVAFVYDRMNKFGGAERVLLALHEIWPDAPFFTAVYDPKGARWANVLKLHTSFLQRISFLRTRHELIPLLTPLAFESFTFDEFDVVISITSAEAKCILTKPGTLHICYCLTPTRYLWSGYRDYLSEPGYGIWNPLVRAFFPLVSFPMRNFDVLASKRPDIYIAISQTVKRRIVSYYKRKKEDVPVIYPPVDTVFFHPDKNVRRKDFFLVVSRLVSYKRIDTVIEAFNTLGLPLVIIGNGSDRNRLQSHAKANIRFVHRYLTDSELRCYYQECRALIFPGEEDFGLTAVEAMACGTPVIAVARGGMEEIVVSGVTGELYPNTQARYIISAVRSMLRKSYKAERYKTKVEEFSQSRFVKLMRASVTRYWKEYKKL